jgi:hypothetical protein
MEFGFNSAGDSIVSAFPKEVEGRTFLITGPIPGGLAAETALTLAKGKPSRLILCAGSKSKTEPPRSGVADLLEKSSARLPLAVRLGALQEKFFDAIVGSNNIEWLQPFQDITSGCT